MCFSDTRDVDKILTDGNYVQKNPFATDFLDHRRFSVGKIELTAYFPWLPAIIQIPAYTENLKSLLLKFTGKTHPLQIFFFFFNILPEKFCSCNLDTDFPEASNKKAVVASKNTLLKSKSNRIFVFCFIYTHYAKIYIL